MNELEKTERVNWLFDLYGDLLTEKQQQYVSMYYREDLSLSEIAEELDVSRNAVYDQLRRALKSLESYETRLHLLNRHEERISLIQKIEKEESMDHSTLLEYLERLKEI